MEKQQYVASIFVMIICILMGVYVGGWLLCLEPILDVLHHIDAGTLTGSIVGFTIIKCFLAGPVASIFFYGGLFFVDYLLN